MKKILFILKIDHSYMSRWATYHYLYDLQNIGHQVAIINGNNYASISELNDEICTAIKDEGYDYFFTPYNETIVAVETVEYARRMGVATILMLMDNGTVPYQHRNVAHAYEALWLFSPVNFNYFKNINKKCIMLPYACSPDLRGEFVDSGLISSVAFVGSPYGSRASTLAYLFCKDVPCDIFGGNSNKYGSNSDDHLELKAKFDFLSSCFGFESSRRILLGKIKSLIQNLDGHDELKFEMGSQPDFYSMGNIYANHKLSIAFTSARNTGFLDRPLEIVNLRSFEIPMAHGIQIVKKCDEILNYFTDGEEIVTYTGMEELLDKTSFYLFKCSDSEIMRIKHKARARAVRDHTWRVRFESVFQFLKT